MSGAIPVSAQAWGPRAALSQVLHPPRLRRAREDYGLFGPGSAVWEVWLYPTAYIAPLRAAIVQMFQPATAAGVAQNRVYQRDPLGRLRRTARYFITVVFGDSRSVVTAADRLRRVHDRVTGHDPVTGTRYAANDPENQLWVHITTWHSMLYCYERYGPGPLPPDREIEYWRGCRTAAELQDLGPAQVPGSRAEVRAYFASMRPQMCVSESAREIIDWLLKPTSSELRLLKPVFVLLARAAAATLPTYLRALGGFDRSRALDNALVPLVRAASRVMTLRPPGADWRGGEPGGIRAPRCRCIRSAARANHHSQRRRSSQPTRRRPHHSTRSRIHCGLTVTQRRMTTQSGLDRPYWCDDRLAKLGTRGYRVGACAAGGGAGGGRAGVVADV